MTRAITNDPAARARRRSALLVGSILILGGALLVACGCGAGVRLQDDLAVQRTGEGPGAALDLVINDAGTASCNRRAGVPITDPQLIQARTLSTALAAEARHGRSLAPGRRPVFRYVVRTPDGHVAFSDDSAGAPVSFGQLQLLVLQIAQQDCHLAR